MAEINQQDLQIFRKMLEKGAQPEVARQAILKAKSGFIPQEQKFTGLAQQSLQNAGSFYGGEERIDEVDTQDPSLLDRLGERLQTIRTQEKERGLGPLIPQNIIDGLRNNSAMTGNTEFNNTLDKIDKLNTILSDIPGLASVKDKIIQELNPVERIKESLQGKTPDFKLSGQALGMVNDVVDEAVQETLQFTGLDKQLEKLANTEVGQRVGQAISGLSKYLGDKIESIKDVETKQNIQGTLEIGEALLNLGGIGSGVKGTKNLGAKTGQGISRIIPQSQEVANKLIDTTFKFTKAQKNKFKSDLFAKGETPSEYLFRKGIIQDTTNSDQVISRLSDLTRTSKQQVDNSLAGIPNVYKNQSTKEALGVVTKQLNDVPGMSDIFNRARELKVKINKGEGLNLSEINEVKRLIDQTNDLVKVTGEFKTGVTKQGLSNLRQNIQRFIEDEASKKGITNIKELNKDTQLSRELLNTISGNLEESGRNRLFGLTDILVGGGTSLGTDFGTGLLAVTVKKLFESEGFKLRFANRINKISPDTSKSIQTKLKNNTPLTSFEKGLIGTAILQAQAEN